MDDISNHKLRPDIREHDLQAAAQGTGGWRTPRGEPSLSDMFGTIRVAKNASFWRKLTAFLGPGYLVAVGYMDPGNWATSLAGGSKFGYALLAVALISNIMAIILQALCARLGIGAGRDLAQACRDAFPKWASWPLWLLAEIAISATDLAEIIGTAIGLNLLFGIPLEIGVLITALDVFLILGLQALGFRWIEAFVVALLGVIAACFALQIGMADPDWGAVIRGFAPTTQIVGNPEMLYLALGILGATVMPHNLYLHSGLVQTRGYGHTEPERREAIKFATIDSTIALCLALTINASILILAAATFHSAGKTDIAELEKAHTLLSPMLGSNSGADPVRHRAAVLRPELDGDRDAVGPDRDGRLHQHPRRAVAAPADDPRHRHRPGGAGDDLVRREGHRRAPDPQSGGAQPATAVRHSAAGDVHREPQEDGRLHRAALAHRRSRCHRRDRDRAEREAGDRFRNGVTSRSSWGEERAVELCPDAVRHEMSLR